MIGKPQWFQRRKYTGWGLFPKTWQGWAYIGIFIALAALIQILPFANDIKIYITSALVIAFIVDVIDIMRRLKLDERDRIHEAIAERNALWAMLFVLGATICYQSITSALQNIVQIDPIPIIALIAGVLVKAATNIYLDQKD